MARRDQERRHEEHPQPGHFAHVAAGQVHERQHKERRPDRDGQGAWGQYSGTAPDDRGQPDGDRQLDRVRPEPEPIGAGIFVVEPSVVMQVPSPDDEGVGPRDEPATQYERQVAGPGRQDQPGARFGPIVRFKLTISAVISPTGRNASVKTMPKAITIPDDMQRTRLRVAGRFGLCWERTAQAASAQADVDSKG